MSTKAKNQSQSQTTGALSNQSRDDFDFELWVKAVKPQLLAALQRSAARYD
jgi:hypothetical protein